MTVHVLKSNFTRGELTPLARARQELEVYGQSVERLLNWTVLRHGGVRRRPGSRYLGSAKYGTSPCALFPFVFSSSQSYALEFGNQYMRVWSRQGSDVNRADNTDASADTTIFKASDGDEVHGLVLNGVGNTVEIATPYTAEDAPSLQFAGLNDIAYIAHKKYRPRKLSRLAHDSWSLTEVTFQDGPYLPINDIGVSLTLSANPTVGALLTFTFSSSMGLVAGDVGRHIRWQLDGNWMWGVIEGVTNGAVFSVRVKTAMSGTPSGLVTYGYRLGAFSDAVGWPGSVTFFEGRLLWGRTNKQPRAVFYSMSNYPEIYSPSNMDGTVVDSHGGAYEIYAGRADEILWLQEAPRLQIGMKGAIRSIGASNIDEVLTPRNISQKREVTVGTCGVPPVQIDTSTVFAGAYGLNLHDMYFDYQVNSLVAPDLTVTAEHLFRKRITAIAFQQAPDRVLWAATNDGKLAGTTFDRYEKVLGFHQHDFSGFVESICSIPGESRDELFMVVRRTINGETRRYVELLEKPFQDDVVTDAFFVDCGVTYSGNAVGTVTGLSHLEGQTVDVLADGKVAGRLVVTGGSITLPNNLTAKLIHIGLPIDNLVKLLRPAVESDDGKTVGRRMRTVYIIADVLDTLGLEVKTAGGQSEPIIFRMPTEPMDVQRALVSGTLRMSVDDTWSGGSSIELTVPQPLPCTVLAVQHAVDVEGMN